MCNSEEECKIKVVKEFDCFISAEFARRLFVLQHKIRPASRHLECEGVKSSRVKSTKDYVEVRVPIKRIKSPGEEICNPQTLQSTPRQLDTSLLGYFIDGECHFVPAPKLLLVMDKVCPSAKFVDFPTESNDADEDNRPNVVSASKNNDGKKEGPNRLESRMKTIDNDDDLRYLRDLYLDPWREGSFNTYESTSSFERRSILMCPEVPEGGHDRGKIDRVTWLPKYLSMLKQSSLRVPDFQFDKGDLENTTLSLLCQARIVKFDKLFERLPLRLPEGYEITQPDLLALLKKFAILIHGWWCIKSEFLYPPKSISPFEGHPREVMIKARDYAMAVFHRGGKLTSKFLVDLTKIHFSEATEILKWLGVRLPPQNGDLSRYWVFREPERAFIERYPSIVYQQAHWWRIRIRQLCREFKMEGLIWNRGKEIDKALSNTVQSLSHAFEQEGGRKSSPLLSTSSENVRSLTVKQIEQECSEPLDAENPSSKLNGRTESAQVLKPPCSNGSFTNDSTLPPLSKRPRVEREFLNGISNEKDETLASKSVSQPPPSKSIIHKQGSRPHISDGCISISSDMSTKNSLLSSSCKEIARQTDPPTISSNPLSKGKQRSGCSPSAPQTKRVRFEDALTENDAPTNVDKSSVANEPRLLSHCSLESSSSGPNLPLPVERARFEKDETSQVGQNGIHADQTSFQSKGGKPLSDPALKKNDSAIANFTISEEPAANLEGLPFKNSNPDMLDIKPNQCNLVDAPQICSSSPIVYRVVANPSKNLLKTEAPVLREESHSIQQSKAASSIADDPEIVALVKSRLNSRPIISLSEITRAVQPHLSSISNSIQAGDNRPPVGSEAERKRLSSDVHRILLAQGAQELNIQWPTISHCSAVASKQPLFVPPPTLEGTSPHDPCIRIRNIILKLLEEKPCVQFGEVKKIAINDGIKVHDGKLRDMIKRYCTFWRSKYFLKYTIN